MNNIIKTLSILTESENPFPNSKIKQVVYHGSPNDFKKYNIKMLGKNTGDPNTTLGMYFTSSKEEAKMYGNNVLEFYINITNPYYTTDTEIAGLDEDTIDDFREEISEGNHDGIIADIEDIDTNSETGEQWFIVFNSKNIRKNFMSNIIKTLAMLEGLRVQDGKFIIDYVKNPDDIHHLNMGKDKAKSPYVMASKEFGGHTVYSSYTLPTNDESKALQKALKGKSNDLGLDIDQYDVKRFVMRTAQHLWMKAIKDKKIDIIITMKSSSDLSRTFASFFQSKIPNIMYLPDTLYKADPRKVTVSDQASQTQKKRLLAIIQTAIDTNTSIEMKNVPVPMRKFVDGFVEYDNIYSKLEGKNILVVDDYLTSGTTMAKAFQILSEMNPLAIYGVTIFK